MQFNPTGAILFLFWIPYFVDLVKWMSPVSSATGMDKLAAETPRQIANAHTLFNVSVAFLFLPFTSTLSKIVLKILPEQESEKGIEVFVANETYNQCTPFIEDYVQNSCFLAKIKG